MKMGKTILAIAMSSAMMTGAHAATDQGHGAITFHGSIIDAPCSIDANSQKQDIELGSISKKTLSAGGKSTPVAVDIKLHDCDLSTAKGATITFNGTAGASASGLDGAFAVNGDGKGVGVVITDIAGVVIKPGAPSTIDLTKMYDGDNQLNFQAYVQGSSVKDAVTAGSFTSVANFMMAYQ